MPRTHLIIKLKNISYDNRNALLYNINDLAIEHKLYLFNNKRKYLFFFADLI